MKLVLRKFDLTPCGIRNICHRIVIWFLAEKLIDGRFCFRYVNVVLTLLEVEDWGEALLLG